MQAVELLQDSVASLALPFASSTTANVPWLIGSLNAIVTVITSPVTAWDELLPLFEAIVIVVAVGAVLSMVTSFDEESVAEFPAASVAVAVIEYVPSLSAFALETVRDHVSAPPPVIVKPPLAAE